MKMIKHLIPLMLLCVFVFAKQSNHKANQDIIIQTVNEQRPVVIENSSIVVPQNREEIDLWVEDFENGQGDWFFSPGWNITNSDSNSPSNSANSPNDASTSDGTHDMITPIISLPALGDGETMNFSFYLNGDMPDSDGDGDNGLEDYYSVSLQDTEALAWQPSPTGSYDGNSYWCGDEEVGGYLDSWIQFLDTPSFVVPNGATMTADMMWSIEDPAGAVIAGSCTDGWDAANVQISVDGGVSWNLLNGSDPYDFDCGYGWIWNSNEYDTGGSLNNLAAGWGGDSGGWNNVSFSLSQYAGQEAMIRFAFGSDPAFCTLDDSSITGFHVDNIVVSGGALSCSPESNCETSVAGAVWVDQFYDYIDVDRPGYQQWEQYVVGMPFNGNVFMDISDFAGKDVQFRIQSRYDADDDGGAGAGLFIDDFRVYKNSGGSFPPPFDLVGEVGNESVSLSWSDLNASGTDDFIYDNDDGTGGAFTNGITVTGESAWAGERIDLAGASTINSISIFNNNLTDTTITVSAFGQFGSLFGNEATHTTTVEAISGQWTTVDVTWDMNNSFIVAHEFNGSFAAAIDESSVQGHSMVMLNAGWDNWSEIAGANALSDGEWGIRTNVTYYGAGATYNVYQDGLMIQSGLVDNTADVIGLANNTTYEFSVSASYNDGADESIQSEIVELTPQAQTVHEEGYDDGVSESEYSVGSGGYTAVKYTAQSEGEAVVRYKWYQIGNGGAFYIKVYEDDGGAPGSEIYSAVVAGNFIVDGWNTYDLSSAGINVAGDFWIGTKAFSSTLPLGVDDSGSGSSMAKPAGSAWTAIDGNLMVRVFLDCGENCSDDPDPGSCTAGDVNGDSVINVLDIVATVNFVLGTGTPSDDEACASDMNGDGIVNVLDIVAIVNIVLGG